MIKNWFEIYKDKIPNNTPVNFINELLSGLMETNVVQFGNTYWKQLIDTVMGTSCVVNYANVYITVLEITIMEPKFKNNLLFLGRYINDGIGIWMDTKENSFNCFMNT